jgi:cell fate regulator YaaT (PSP1 superfamily)
MQVVKVKFHKADREYFFLPQFIEGDSSDIKVGDQVIVETNLGQDLGTISYIGDQKKEAVNNDEDLEVKPMLRLARKTDFDQIKNIERKYPQYLKECQQLCDKHKLNMKLSAVHESLDGARLTFYFIAGARVDFRDLVRDLVSKFHKKIRLQQIGVRDEAKISGDYGSCGLQLCCKNWLKTLGNVNAEFIRDQELLHRGNERLSGVCGRLKCCLRYEEEAYKYSLEKLPKTGDQIKTKAGMGEVVNVHTLKQTVDLKIGDAVVEYPYLEGNLCQYPVDCDGQCGGNCPSCKQ